MKYFIKLFAVVTVLIVLCASGCSKQPAASSDEYEVTDCQGMVVYFKEKPKRIVTATKGTDTIVLGLVKPDKMVACDRNLDDPNSSNMLELVKEIPNRVHLPKLEELLVLQPDLVIAVDWGNLDYVQSLRDMGINVVVVRGAKNLSDVKENITLISAALGEPEKGQQLISQMEARLNALKEKVDRLVPRDQRQRAVLISRVAYYGGKGCIYDDACQWAGVINGLAEAGLHRGTNLTKEMIIKIDPDVLFLPSYSMRGLADKQSFRDNYIKDPSLQHIKAIKNGKVREPRDAYIYSASQDFCFGAQEIAYCAYGDEFKQDDQQHLSVAE